MLRSSEQAFRTSPPPDSAGDGARDRAQRDAFVHELAQRDEAFRGLPARASSPSLTNSRDAFRNSSAFRWSADSASDGVPTLLHVRRYPRELAHAAASRHAVRLATTRPVSADIGDRADMSPDFARRRPKSAGPALYSSSSRGGGGGAVTHPRMWLPASPTARAADATAEAVWKAIPRDAIPRDPLR
jgi:hypothetical protein